VTTPKESDFPRSDRAPESFWDFADRLLNRIAAKEWNWSKTFQTLLLVGCLAAALIWAAHELTGLPAWAVGIGAGGVGAGTGLRASRSRRRRAVSGGAPQAGDPAASPEENR
jgi:hypothetical protein